MASDPTPMPFDLPRDADLSNAEIFYAFYSPKSGAGRQEITILGTGEVRLFYSRTADDPAPLERTGHVDPGVVLRLLDVIDGKSFVRLDDHYPPEDHQFARRVIRIAVPGVSKEVVMQRTGVEVFEQVAVAIELTAGLALPEAINHRFFPNL